MLQCSEYKIKKNEVMQRELAINLLKYLKKVINKIWN